MSTKISERPYTYITTLETDGIVDHNDLHEHLCKAIYEYDMDSRHWLRSKITDIKVFIDTFDVPDPTPKP